MKEGTTGKRLEHFIVLLGIVTVFLFVFSFELFSRERHTRHALVEVHVLVYMLYIAPLFFAFLSDRLYKFRMSHPFKYSIVQAIVFGVYFVPTLFIVLEFAKDLKNDIEILFGLSCGIYFSDKVLMLLSYLGKKIRKPKWFDRWPYSRELTILIGAVLLLSVFSALIDINRKSALTFPDNFAGNFFEFYFGGMTKYIIPRMVVATGVNLLVFLTWATLIAINYLVLIPKMLAKHKYLLFLASATLCVIGFHIVFAEVFEYLPHTFMNKEIFRWKDRVPGPYIGVNAGVMIVSVPVIMIYEWFKQKQTIDTLTQQRLTAELDALKNQINPHFFFNTLNNLYALTLTHSERAPEVVLKLSDILRYTIYECREDWVPVGKEIKCLRDYIALQEIRLKRPASISFDVDVEDEAVLVAPLVFIVFVENAFKHGVETVADGAYLRISLKLDKGFFVFNCENNYEPEEGKTPGIGLENVRKRLGLLYPNSDHSLKINRTDEVFSVKLVMKVPRKRGVMPEKVKPEVDIMTEDVSESND
ncbi:hypothetical protein FUAX_27320 [Fulvitalea axinellae]|uniref:Signal transduction histidine kinase internal region domain-containing protein n=1 Tax=Fulvitalea axinellae TaxID=1182444 RepID=A0AAU9DGX3_9BACT|nr:hypothetical protein FUAX_27320 [Fulvitalea axinellae]